MRPSPRNAYRKKDMKTAPPASHNAYRKKDLKTALFCQSQQISIREWTTEIQASFGSFRFCIDFRPRIVNFRLATEPIPDGFGGPHAHAPRAIICLFNEDNLGLQRNWPELDSKTLANGSPNTTSPLSISRKDITRNYDSRKVGTFDVRYSARIPFGHSR